ncbi:MAG: hypothetical protein MMC33_007594 [Icmadophila ericetorum]|nr:hypothetical protein [Icmadophila ericetorum]
MSLGSVLVTGGCGFIGFHVVKRLVEDVSFSSVHVISRKPTRNQLPGVNYHTCDVTSFSVLYPLVVKIEPRTIIHLAARVSDGDDSDQKTLFHINVEGTENMICCAATVSSVEAFVHTSPMSILETCVNNLTDETAPILRGRSRANYYSKTRSLAETTVLAANDRCGLRTTCLRLCRVYGERDSSTIPTALSWFRNGYHHYQLGDNRNLCDFVSVTNAATAHVLAVKGLLVGIENPEGPTIDGEAFNITDGMPVPYWDFLRLIWTAAAGTDLKTNLRVIPAWYILALASIIEWLFWIFTCNTKRPRYLRRYLFEETVNIKTFSIEKARKRLGYTPINDRTESIAKGVQWVLLEEETKLKAKAA